MKVLSQNPRNFESIHAIFVVFHYINHHLAYIVVFVHCFKCKSNLIENLKVHK